MPGLVIIDIASTGQAAKLGMRQHDVLLKYNGQILMSVEDLITPGVTKVENELVLIRGREVVTVKVAQGSLGVSLVPYPIPDVSIAGVGEVMSSMRAEIDAQSGKQKQAQDEVRNARIAAIQVTTAPSLEGYKVTRTVDIITAEYVGGVNILRDVLTNWTDVLGGRSATLQNELRIAREVCLANLKAEADRVCANAVIAVDLDYSEISGGGKSMLFLVASGTAVIVE